MNKMWQIVTFDNYKPLATCDLSKACAGQAGAESYQNDDRRIKTATATFAAFALSWAL